MPMWVRELISQLYVSHSVLETAKTFPLHSSQGQWAERQAVKSKENEENQQRSYKRRCHFTPEVRASKESRPRSAGTAGRLGTPPGVGKGQKCPREVRKRYPDWTGSCVPITQVM